MFTQTTSKHNDSSQTAFVVPHYTPLNGDEYCRPELPPLESPALLECIALERKRDAEKRKKVLNFAKICTIIVAFVFAIILTVACAAVPAFAALGYPFFAAIALASFFVNWLVFRQGVKNTFLRLFCDGIGKSLSKFKKVLMWISLLFAMGNGFATSALSMFSFSVTWAAIGNAIGAGWAIALFTSPLFVLPIACLFTVPFFFALSALTFDSMSTFIREDGHQKIRDFFKRIFSRNKAIPKVQDIAESVAQILFMVTGLLVTAIALIATLGAASNAMITMLSQIPNASMQAVQIASYIIVLGVAGVARLPYFLEKTATVFGRIGLYTGKSVYHAVHTLFHPSTWRAKGAAFKAKCSGAWQKASKQPAHVFLFGVAAIGTCFSIALNALANGALGDGGAEYVQGVFEGVHLPVSADEAQQDAMMASAAISGVVGTAGLIDSGLAARAEAEKVASQKALAQRALKRMHGPRNIFSNTRRNRGGRAQRVSHPQSLQMKVL